MSDDNVLIVGANFRNKGAAAMAQTAVDKLEEPDVVISSIFDEDLESGDQYNVIKHVRLLELFLKEILHIVTGGILRPNQLFSRWQQKRDELGTYLKYVHQADVVVDLSGYALTDKFGTLRIWSWVEVVFLSRLLGKPFVMLPQSVGPLKKFRKRLLVRVALPFGDSLSVRGSVSERWLKKAGVQDFAVYPDTAFLFEPAPVARANEILTEAGLSNQFVTIVPNARLYERWEDYESELAAIADTVLEQGYEVLLLPHEYTDDGNIDDQYVIAQIRQREEFDNAVIIEQELSARELKAVVGESDLLIGSRLHSTVAGVSTNVPTIAIGWSEKYYEILEWVDSEDDVWIPSNYDRGSVIERIEEICTQGHQGYSNLREVKRKAKKSYDSVRMRLDK